MAKTHSKRTNDNRPNRANPLPVPAVSARPESIHQELGTMHYDLCCALSALRVVNGYIASTMDTDATLDQAMRLAIDAVNDIWRRMDWTCMRLGREGAKPHGA